MRKAASLVMVMLIFSLTVYAQQGEQMWRGLRVEPENKCRGHVYRRSDYQYPQSREADIKDEIGNTDGGWYGFYEATVFSESTKLDIEHIVATAEAHHSGLCERSDEEKQAFANDLHNLTLATPRLNRQKGSKDAAEWLPQNARCEFARRVVFVKQTHNLSVDPAEKAELERILDACSQGIVPLISANEPAIDFRVRKNRTVQLAITVPALDSAGKKGRVRVPVGLETSLPALLTDAPKADYVIDDSGQMLITIRFAIAESATEEFSTPEVISEGPEVKQSADEVPEVTEVREDTGGAAPSSTPVMDHPPIKKFRNCTELKNAGWKRGVNRAGGTYSPAWNEAEIQTYEMNPSRDRDKDGRACSS